MQELLAVQDCDLKADQLRYRLAHLPEQAEVDAVAAEVAGIDRRLAALAEERRSVDKHLRLIDDEVLGFRRRIEELEAALYSGGKAIRELEAIQGEIASLKAHQEEAEDRELEVMEAEETLDAQIADLDAERTAAAERLAVTEAARDVAAADATAELERITGERAGHVEGVGADLLAAYEESRRRHGGVGVASVEGRRCQGCHLEIPAAQLDALRHAPAEERTECPECGRLLVVRRVG